MLISVESRGDFTAQPVAWGEQLANAVIALSADRESETYVGEALKAFSGVDDLEAIGDALVHRRVSLQKRLG